MARVGWRETFGLIPLGKAAREALVAVRGDPETPGTHFDTTSLGLLLPRLSLSLWLGRRRADRRIVISNFFNRTPTPIEDGWSVRVTQVRDFRGGRCTYDAHNGTDFAVPVGTVVVAAGPGRVLRVASEFHRGGLKVFVDQASLLYLDGAEVDFVETLEGSGFKFNNPQVKSTCGCGSSFQV